MTIFNRQVSQYSIHIFLFSLFLVGVTLVGDYNIASDEEVNRRNGGVSANFVINKINRVLNTSFFQNDTEFKAFDSDLNIYSDRDYGVAFDVPLFILERILEIDTPKNQYMLRHFFNFLIYLIGVYAFYKLAQLRFVGRLMPLLLTTMLVLSPRIFPDAFYNYKDVLFLSLTVIAVYTMIRAVRMPSYWNIFLHGMTTALAIDIRVLGVMIFVGTNALMLLMLIKRKVEVGDFFKFIAIFCCSAIFFTILFWPWLWINPFRIDLWHVPIERFFEAFTNMSRFRWEGLVLFRGVYISATELPWFYLPFWISISTPLLYLVFACFGGVLICAQIFKTKLTLWTTFEELLDIIFLSLLIGPLIIIIYIKSVVYDGWRQVYFIYPWLILVSGVGIQKCFFISAIIKKMFLIIIASYLFAVGYQMYKMHPYQMVYFNELISNGRAAQYELDYWGQSTREALSFIINNDDRYEIKLYYIGNSTIKQTLLMFDANARKLFVLTEDPYDADYLIYNHRIIAFWNLPILKYAQTDRDLFYQVISGKQILFSVFK
jgi:hypothetical protein